MKIGKGVERAVHCCTILALLPAGAALPGEALAEFLDVAQPYLAKQLQALSRAGIVTAQSGAAGGYQLARPAQDISLWDVTEALEGTQPLYRSAELRRDGPFGAPPDECLDPCHIETAFMQAEAEYRRTLQAIPITHILHKVRQTMSEDRRLRIRKWIENSSAERV
ncbi:MAG: Rrf2 family transcriptional regulator [Pseudomonadota bacterium]